MFEKNVKTSWQELQLEENYSDIILACEGKHIKTHKLVISSFSPVLRNILKLNQTFNPLIYLKGVKFKDLQNLLNFMYQGQVDVAEDDLSSFLEIAEDLNVLGLSEKNAEVCYKINTILRVLLHPKTLHESRPWAVAPCMVTSAATHHPKI